MSMSHSSYSLDIRAGRTWVGVYECSYMDATQLELVGDASTAHIIISHSQLAKLADQIAIRLAEIALRKAEKTEVPA